ncbi:hypothetical protein GCG54_00013162 [Colletotrichum gloeosporioides]|uniref:T6SS Phospholipase effector Tle1-like catalytic domain-containing protein n=1 Tax=Colletotrichum gloeosporioides TaxID=474922 RepID=A0A8H4FDJ3_COLGL|nr:uncharacterized protein GCG54_00013162 [Colletotrichum gloeosporioides]KAF3798422.1 hypothetical protein GCG54_00013162 [Colletotrichum gloeosporioides]
MADEQAENLFHAPDQDGIGNGDGSSHYDAITLKADGTVAQTAENSEGHDTNNNDGSPSTASNITDHAERWWMQTSDKKRLFICCDGTWQNASGTTTPLTNVAKLARAVFRLGEDDYEHADPEEEASVRQLAKTDPDELGNKEPRDDEAHVGLVRQVIYYSGGIGGQAALNVERGYSGLTGKGLEANILNAYCFICNNYNGSSGKDEIVLVGFSRGAFAVRCLANFIDKVGLLRRKGLTFLRPLFDSWKRWGRANGDDTTLESQMNALRELLIPDVKIHILAEWDSVSAIGLPLGLWREKFSFVNKKVPGCVKHALFALALDEKRRSFKPRQWTAKASPQTEVQQCAFVGCHSDIGGGNADPGLSLISLFWMISKIQATSHAAFDDRTLLQFMFPHQPKRSLLDWRTPKMELKNFAGSTGEPDKVAEECDNRLTFMQGPVHKSLRRWWCIPWALSLGLLNGKRDKILHKGEDECKLEVHFTVNLLGKSRLNNVYRYDNSSPPASWLKKTNNETVLKEAVISSQESKLLKD